MGLSETIMAAMIGALATVTTALFQLFTVLRSRAKVDARPKKGVARRSVLAILSLMVASAAGGFLYSEFLKQRSGEDMRAMRQELKQLTALIAEGRDEAGAGGAADVVAQHAPADIAVPAALEHAAHSVESMVYVPACRSTGALARCKESDAQRIALCGTVPAYAHVHDIELFAQPDAVQQPWEPYRADFDQDLGGARFTGNSFEYAQDGDLKAVCVNFLHWSSEHPHIARVVLQYGFGDAPANAAPLTAAAEPATADATPAAGTPAIGQAEPGTPSPSGSTSEPVHVPAVVAADSMPVIPQATSLAGPAARK